MAGWSRLVRSVVLIWLLVWLCLPQRPSVSAPVAPAVPATGAMTVASPPPPAVPYGGDARPAVAPLPDAAHAVTAAGSDVAALPAPDVGASETPAQPVGVAGTAESTATATLPGTDGMPSLPSLPTDALRAALQQAGVAAAVPTAGTITAGAARPAVVSADGQSVTIQVTVGWNLFGLPLGSTSAVNASDVLTSLLGATGGSLAALYGLTRNVWSPSFIKTSSGTIGHDFALQVGQGYLLYSDTAGSFSMPGVPFTGSLTWGVTAGWSLASLTQGAGGTLQASELLNTLMQATGGSLAAIYGLTGGAWSTFLIKTASGTIGHDFTLQVGPRIQPPL